MTIEHLCPGVHLYCADSLCSAYMMDENSIGLCGNAFYLCPWLLKTDLQTRKGRHRRTFTFFLHYQLLLSCIAFSSKAGWFIDKWKCEVHNITEYCCMFRTTITLPRTHHPRKHAATTCINTNKSLRWGQVIPICWIWCRFTHRVLAHSTSWVCLWSFQLDKITLWHYLQDELKFSNNLCHGWPSVSLIPRALHCKLEEAIHTLWRTQAHPGIHDFRYIAWSVSFFYLQKKQKCSSFIKLLNCCHLISTCIRWTICFFFPRKQTTRLRTTDVLLIKFNWLQNHFSSIKKKRLRFCICFQLVYNS